MEMFDGPLGRLRALGQNEAADAIEKVARAHLPETVLDLQRLGFDTEKQAAADLIGAMFLDGKTPEELEVIKAGYTMLLTGYARRLGAERNSIVVDLSSDEALRGLVGVAQRVLAPCTLEGVYPSISPNDPKIVRWGGIIPPHTVRATIEGLGLHGKRKPKWQIASELERNTIDDLWRTVFETLAANPHHNAIKRLGLVQYEIPDSSRARYLRKMPDFSENRHPEFAAAELAIAADMQPYVDERIARKEELRRWEKARMDAYLRRLGLGGIDE